ncbi:hypothetical protein PISMIDRAFT_690856 [Pisolithus microcarpus 441]|uniref:Uncharacterized protein n=1 Tax=Pisolithus microcarpus 441 TaxID=765257 RepID=A0A0C9Y9I4_9AGAM|nr:hypothetical protein PISMIDRAFT_690856 [Pisolithus microcarpus 441]
MTAAHGLPAFVQANGTTTTICKTAQLQHAHHTVFELSGTRQTTRRHYEPIMTRLDLQMTIVLDNLTY